MLARPEIGSTAHMLLWAAGRDPTEIYDWSNMNECACGQYSRDNGLKEINGKQVWLTFDHDHMYRLNLLAREEPRTFGALYDRMRAEWNAI